MKTLTMLGAILRGLSYHDGRCACVSRLTDSAAVDRLEVADLLRIDGAAATEKAQLTEQLRAAWEAHLAAHGVSPRAVTVNVEGKQAAFGVGRTFDQARSLAARSLPEAKSGSGASSPASSKTSVSSRA